MAQETIAELIADMQDAIQHMSAQNPHRRVLMRAIWGLMTLGKLNAEMKDKMAVAH